MKIKPYLDEMNNLIHEIISAKENIQTVMEELDRLDLRYQGKEINYKDYITTKKKILSGRKRDNVEDAYKTYTNSLKKKLKQLNSKILKAIYEDKSHTKLVVSHQPKKIEKQISLPPLETLEVGEFEIPQAKKEEKEAVILEEKEKEIEMPDIRVPEAPAEPEAPAPGEMEFLKAPSPAKLSFIKRLVYAFQAKEKPWLDKAEAEGVQFGGIFSRAFIDYLLEGKEKAKKQEFGETKVLPSILSYEQKKSDSELEVGRKDILDPYLLEKQIKELKSLISKKKPEIYKASTLGYLSNITVRKISIYFIEKYPEFFRKIYTSVRYANMKVLANTYINIIFFLTLVSGMLSIPIFTVFFALQGGPPGMIMLKTIGAVIFVANFVFWMGVYYPSMKAKSRRRSINTNLPFAIDHMSSVISSGVSPATMFNLISNSREYGEISIEIEKVVNYTEFFGYDILTALKAVALTTPSSQFKEFIDGFVSTIETGGDLKNFLSQKSGEALLNYRLERQKYVESLSTYSDIYTGVLIAAPLFFVTALSLVSVLGGTIGGMSVNSIITLGTYLVIPGMNILFLVFLELNQPEI
ncbi:type II secretion system F family protein [Candidatus Woesearchaeota archaeon]|nr:type II secretion system F family protein [Candidatus Woesearchaeota archaeon]